MNLAARATMAARMNSGRLKCNAPDRMVTTFIGGRWARPEVISISRIVPVPVGVSTDAFSASKAGMAL